MKSLPGRLIPAITLVVLLAWTTFVLASLYAIQKPFPVTVGRQMARTVWYAAAPAVIFISAGLLGMRILSALGVRSPIRFEQVLFAEALGTGVLGILIFLLGAWGILHRTILQVLFAAGLCFLIAELFRLRSRLLSAVHLPRPPWWLSAYCLWMAGLTLLIALAPPWGWDSLFYHLVIPRQALETGSWPLTAGIPHVFYPSFMESLFAWCMAVAGDCSAAPLHALFAAGTAGAVYALSRRLTGRHLGWLGIAIWTSMPMVFVLSSWAYTDMALAFFLAVALLAAAQWMEQRDRRWLWIAGACAGLSMGVKYTAAIGTAALAGWIIWEIWNRFSFKTSAFGDFLHFAIPSALLASPWYVRNALIAGNPVYPFVFGGPGWDAFRAHWYGRPGSGLGWDILQLLILPWTATVGIRDANYYDGQTGPMFLLLLPALVIWLMLPRFRRQLPALAGPLLWCAGVLAVAWTFGVIQSQALFQTRLLLPCFTLLAPVMAFLLSRLDELVPMPGNISARRLATAALLITLALNSIAWTAQTIAFNPFPVLVGLESEEAYLERNLGSHAIAMRELAHLPAGSRVLFLWEPRTYYSPVPAYPDAILDNWPHAVSQLENAAQIADRWRSQGFTHILLYRSGLDFIVRTGLDPLTPLQVAELNALLASHAERIPWPADPQYELYALRPAGALLSPETAHER